MDGVLRADMTRRIPETRYLIARLVHLSASRPDSSTPATCLPALGHPPVRLAHLSACFAHLPARFEHLPVLRTPTGRLPWVSHRPASRTGPRGQDGEVTSMEIRTARPEDVAAAAELRWLWFQERRGTPPVPLEEFVPAFVAWAGDNAATHRCTVALRDGRVVGMAWLAIIPRVPHAASFERASGDVQCVYVRPEERNNGLGGRLIEAVLEAARDLDLERVTVHSSERAVTAYERGGFEVSPHLLQVDLRRR